MFLYFGSIFITQKQHQFTYRKGWLWLRRHPMNNDKNLKKEMTKKNLINQKANVKEKRKKINK